MRWWMGAGILLALLGLLGLVLLFGETRSERTGREGAGETARAETARATGNVSELAANVTGRVLRHGEPVDAKVSVRRTIRRPAAVPHDWSRYIWSRHDPDFYPPRFEAVALAESDAGAQSGFAFRVNERGTFEIRAETGDGWRAAARARSPSCEWRRHLDPPRHPPVPEFPQTR